MTRPFRHLAPLAALLLAACLNDTPVAPHATRVALRVNLQTTVSGARLAYRVYYFLPGTETASTLYAGDVAVTGGLQQVPVSFDLAPCLAAQASVNGGKSCSVWVDVQLIVNAAIVDMQAAGPLEVTPGATVESPPVFLVAGSTAPQVTGDTAVAVDLDLVRYRMSASDPDGDLAQLFAMLSDSTGNQVGLSLVQFAPPRGTLAGARYISVDTFATTSAAMVQDVDLSVYDTKGNAAGPIAIPLTPVGSAAPFASAVVGDTTHDSLSVGFNVSSSTGTPDSVDIVVRNVRDSQLVQDTIYFVCGGRFTGGSGTHTVTCSRSAPFERARVTVVPFDDQGNWGSASTCDLPGNCAVAVRRRRE
ncbi:MAG TPA: hypothetical protein VF041_18545 [Gemmatimonadaceae bacterium]